VTPPPNGRFATTALALAATAAAALAPAPARAYDPATTHAGLTERSVLASDLHKVLSRRMGRPLGLFEPVPLDAAALPLAEARNLEARLATLDPAGGYRPAGGAAPALSWVVAGAVIALTPPERAGNLFYDPARGSGLTEGGGFTEFLHGTQLLLDSTGSVRAASTGTSFNLTGPPATQWLLAHDNDVGLTAFYDGLEAAATGEDAVHRSTALARALMALGGTLAVLQDAGEPAHVRNDFLGAYLDSAGSGPFDRSSAFERFVADAYGRVGVPAAGTPVDRPTVMAYFTGSDGQGLADRTQRRFFSEGTVPEDAIVERDSTAADVMRDARGTLTYGLPVLPRLELRAMGERRYVYAVTSGSNAGERFTSAPPRAPAAKAGARKVLGYERVPGRVRFFLDRAVFADSARALLPEIAAYGTGLVDHLFRVEVQLAMGGGAVSTHVVGAHGAVRGGQIRVYADDAKGIRRLAGTIPADGEGSVALPAGSRRVAAVLRAEDDAGAFVAVSEQPVR
jgi:hypothetical protein